ncbi:MAG: dephospho-CoA kinase [Verrucomicrobia bacterium]|nr:dephospho-CoA kinase [Verrucomicrobiota bacterium]
MLILKKVAVTGGFASGKTTVCQMFKKFGAFVVDSDAIVHQLLSLDTAIGKQVVELLGKEIITGNQIDRKKIAKIVFSDPHKLKALEVILHPAVQKSIAASFDKILDLPQYSFFVAEVPLLFEAKMEDDFDLVIAVRTSAPVAKARLKEHQEFDRRMARQLSDKTEKADFIIDNDGDLKTLEKQIKTIIPELKESP